MVRWFNLLRGKQIKIIIGDLKFNPPIIQGGMGVRVSTASLVSAVSNEGALGVIASVGLGEEVKRNISYEERSVLAFKEIIENYPKSPLVDDAKYKIALCAAGSTAGPEYNEEDTEKGRVNWTVRYE